MMSFKEIEYQGRDWIKLAQDRGPVTRLCKYGTDPSGSINVREFTLCFRRVILPLGVSYNFQLVHRHDYMYAGALGSDPVWGPICTSHSQRHAGGLEPKASLNLRPPGRRSVAVSAPLSNKCWSPNSERRAT
jgi:hypothetical protein